MEENMQHRSDCATHNMPAMPTGKCDCGVATRIDLRWIVDDRLALEVSDGTVTVHQRDRISREKWNTLILRDDDLRALAKALDWPKTTT